MSLERLLARARQLEASERWPAAQLQELQTRQAARLLNYACAQVPYYRDRAAEFETAAPPGTARWRNLPQLSRADVLQQADALKSVDSGPALGGIYKVSTSGSTGEPVSVWRGDLSREVWEATALREHRWQGRDPARSMAIIRAGMDGGAAPRGRRISRGYPFVRFWQCGPTWSLDMGTDVAQQAEWLRRIRPDYLLTYPANLQGVLPHLAGRGAGLKVLQVVGVGGTVNPEVRELCREILGCEIASNYSSQEMGIMALGCPHCRQYHVQSENFVVEVLNEAGEACEPGEAGSLVVTDLHNYVMPMIRYQIGDYAIPGEPCAGGITLPTLRTVLGRRRNMVVHADGRRHWPLTGFARFRDVAPVLRYQVVQHDLRDIELRVAVAAPLSAPQGTQLAAIVAEALAGDFQVRVSAFPDRLPDPPSVKFEEFVSHVS